MLVILKRWVSQSAEFLLMADFVAKVFLGCRTKILRAADAFARGAIASAPQLDIALDLDATVSA